MRNLLLSVGLLLSFGCGVSPATAPTTYYDFLMGQNQIICEAQARCCGVKCSASSDSTLVRTSLDTQRFIDAGKLTLDSQAAQTCLDAQRARYDSCDVLLPNLPDPSLACSRVIVGTVAVGSACDPVSTNFCVSNAYCDGLTRACTKYLGSGESCMTGRCGSNLFCDTMSRTCKALPKNGESCAVSLTCDPSGAKLVCLPNMVCGSPLDDGQMCQTASQCKSSLCATTCAPATTPPRSLRNDLCRALR